MSEEPTNATDQLVPLKALHEARAQRRKLAAEGPVSSPQVRETMESKAELDAMGFSPTPVLKAGLLKGWPR